jgi:ribosomal protein L11 methyltransferase
MEVAEVDLYDIDPDALENSRQNIDLNFDENTRVGIRVLAPSEKQLAVGPYELIFANILLPVLLEERDFLISRLDIGGVLILSGILNEQIAEIRQAYLKPGNLELMEHVTRGDWATLLFKRGL